MYVEKLKERGMRGGKDHFDLLQGKWKVVLVLAEKKAAKMRRSRSGFRRSKSCLDMNRGAIFGDTAGPVPSAPIVQGGFSHQEEMDRLRTCYSSFHGSKVAYHDPSKAIASKPSSRRLLAGTNEYAEDLTGQRQPLNASSWRSETKVSSKDELILP